MSVKSNPGTSVQWAGSKSSDTSLAGTPSGARVAIAPHCRTLRPVVQLFGVGGLPEIEPGDDLAALIAERAELVNEDVVVVTSKVVSKSEGATIELDTVTPSVFASEFA